MIIIKPMVISYKISGNLPCFRCGICCSRYQVRIEPEEGKEIAYHLGMDWENFKLRYTDSRWPGKNSFLIAHRNGACIFLEHELNSNATRCTIHSFRPRDCREWQPSIEKEECRKGLLSWGLNFNNNGDLEGSEENLKKFLNVIK